MHNKIPQNLWNKLQNQAAEALGDEFWEDMAALMPHRMPRVDAFLRDDRLVVLAELPGVEKQEDIQVKMGSRSVELIGRMDAETEELDSDRILIQERSAGPFNRKLTLPFDIVPETAAAEIRHGLLRVTVNRKREEAAKALPVRFGDKSDKNGKSSGGAEAAGAGQGGAEETVAGQGVAGETSVGQGGAEETGAGQGGIGKHGVQPSIGGPQGHDHEEASGKKPGGTGSGPSEPVDWTSPKEQQAALAKHWGSGASFRLGGGFWHQESKEGKHGPRE